MFSPKHSFPAQDSVATNEENMASLKVLLCLSTGSSFYNGKKPVVSMSLKVLKFCQEESYKALCTRNLNYSTEKQRNLWSPQSTSTTLLTLSPFIKCIPFTWVPSPVTGSLVRRTKDVHLKWQTLFWHLPLIKGIWCFPA